MKTSPLLLAAALGLAFAALGHAEPKPLPEATAAHLPRWRGFNLVEKFNVASNRPFAEEDFQIVSELGFNFVRLPMDYRIWIKNGDWKQIDESALAGIDQAVAYGEKYGVHVCLNFHRAPGYTVAKPPEEHDLWTDPEAQEVCAAHWACFARRYKGIPNNRLSFDLLNEPGKVAPEIYRAVVQKLVEAIHREDPRRLVIADGLRWGNDPCPELSGLGIAQATRGYTPMSVSHYLASWIDHDPVTTAPVWPLPRLTSILKAAGPNDPAKEIVIEGPFAAATEASVLIGKVQPTCQFLAEADGKPLLSQTWSAPLEAPQTLRLEIPAGTQALKLSVKSGWASAPTVTLQPKEGAPCVLRLWKFWDAPSALVRFDPANTSEPFKITGSYDRAWLQTTMIAPWKALEAQGVGVFVGEWGVFNKTPHAVTLAFMEDCLRNWQEAGWGWALWNLYGGFGILDSERADVQYEDYHGHKLDRAMLELLQRY